MTLGTVEVPLFAHYGDQQIEVGSISVDVTLVPGAADS